MALSPGTHLGHYDVTTLLGEGGMGQVWQAADTQLNRQVALKILPDAFADDPDRLARFTREAQILASLNHPNIAAIHGIEEAEGVRALVLEMVEGPTLADRIAHGAMPIEDALPIATQIAEALEAAHEAGVIHRDLKPANIKVRDDGTVKVLDFGLAKALEPAPASATADPSQSPTLTAAATQMGVIMGTAAYMSPEQARGKPVDRRADVWAFGIVLLEMLTGRTVFEGDDVSMTLSSVLQRDPDWSHLPPNVPPVLTVFLHRCLEKNPKQRVHDIADVRLAMTGAFETAGTELTLPGVVSRQSVWQRPVPMAGTVLAAVLVGGFAVWALGRDVVSETTSTRFTLTLPASDRMQGGSGDLLALSPDGRTLIYRATRDGVAQLFRRPLDQFEATPIRGTIGAQHHFMSADGQWVGFDNGQMMLKVPLAGGAAQALTAATLRGADWGNDDMIVYGLLAGDSLLQIPATGGEPTTLFTSEDGRNVYWPHVLADGDAVLFTLSDGPGGAKDLHVFVRSTKERRLLIPDASAGRILPTGHLLFIRGGALWAVPFDADRLDVVGIPVPVLDRVRVETGGGVQFAVADDGSLVYIDDASGGTARSLVLVDRGGEEELLALPAGAYQGPTLSPDGRRAAVVVVAGDAGGQDRMLVSDLGRGTMSRFTAHEGADIAAPVWSHDGRYLAFSSTDRDEHSGVFRQAADGSGTPERVLVDESFLIINPADWSADGRTLLLTAMRPDTSRDVGMVAADGTGGWVPLVATAADESAPTLSADGRWFAYVSANDTGSSEVYVQRFPDLGGRQPVSVGGGFSPRWSEDGAELFYVQGVPPAGESLMRVSVDETDDEPPTLRLGAPEALFDWRYLAVLDFVARSFDVTADGQQFLVVKSSERDVDVLRRAEIHVVLNWTRELVERVPIN